MLFLFDISIANALSHNKGFVPSKTKTQFLGGYCDNVFDTVALRKRVPTRASATHDAGEECVL
jgi:hypothetical protein